MGQDSKIERFAQENKKWPRELARVPMETFPPWEWETNPPKEVWRSRGYLAMIFDAPGDVERMTVNRTSIDGKTWKDGITWDDLQRLKRECGRGEKMAVEIFPPDNDIVNVANMRHIWIMPEPLLFMWRTK